MYLKLVLGSYTATRRYLLKADIQGFFPSVNHDWLLENVIMEKRILKEFLKAGYLENYVIHVTDEGFPQGSPVSPPLANLTLNGLEEYLGKDFLTTRYADDFIVAGKSLEEFKNVTLPKISSFLSERGLNLDLDKTSVYSIEEGFFYYPLSFMESPLVYDSKETQRAFKILVI
jgi:RNA-directed DNA polymerase